MTRKRSIVQGLMVLALAGMLVVTLTGMASAAKKFGLADIPKIKNKRPLHTATLGWQATWTVPVMKKFSEHTGIPLTYELHTNEMTYAKLNVELILGTGAYDVIPVEAAWACEWSPYLWDIYELADKFDPEGRAALAADVEQNYSAIIRQISDTAGKVVGVPICTYQDAMWFRQDAFDDPTEKANFKKRYGYELKPPTTWKELFDQGEFFTRKKGELFKGKPLEWDLYGLNVEGKSEINDDISAEIWGRGGHWFNIIRDKQGKPIEFVITEENRRVIKEALASEKKQLQWASPICLTSYYPDLVPLWNEGRVIVWPHEYTTLMGWAAEVLDNIPGAKLGFSPGINGTGLYVGHYPPAVPKSSKNPEAAYWLMRYFASYEAQKEMFEKNGPITRMDILRDPKYQTAKWARFCGPYAKVIDDILTNYQTAEVTNDYIWFNTAAGCKMYEMTIVECHDAMTGRKSIEKTANDILKQMMALQKKFGKIPIRSEIEFK
jgi:multiple sugar transport system substrate-binding protein